MADKPVEKYRLPKVHTDKKTGKKHIVWKRKWVYLTGTDAEIKAILEKQYRIPVKPKKKKPKSDKKPKKQGKPKPNTKPQKEEPRAVAINTNNFSSGPRHNMPSRLDPDIDKLITGIRSAGQAANASNSASSVAINNNDNPAPKTVTQEEMLPYVTQYTGYTPASAGVAASHQESSRSNRAPLLSRIQNDIKNRQFEQIRNAEALRIQKLEQNRIAEEERKAKYKAQYDAALIAERARTDVLKTLEEVTTQKQMETLMVQDIALEAQARNDAAHEALDKERAKIEEDNKRAVAASAEDIVPELSAKDEKKLNDEKEPPKQPIDLLKAAQKSGVVGVKPSDNADINEFTKEALIKVLAQLSPNNPHVKTYNRHKNDKTKNTGQKMSTISANKNELREIIRSLPGYQKVLNTYRDQYGVGEEEDEDDNGGLWTDQIIQAMTKYHNFIGCIAADQFDSLLPRIKPNTKIGFISNLSDSNEPGTHWVAIAINGTDEAPDKYTAMYFDPFGRDIPEEMQVELHRLEEKISPNHPIFLKVNRIDHQTKSSENCGYHSMLFLEKVLDPTRPQSFKQATDYIRRSGDTTGAYEKEIEELKKLPPWDHLNKRGGKFLDTAKKVGEKIIGIIKTAITFIRGRKGAPPEVKNFIAKYGDQDIKSITVCREPVTPAVTKVVNLLTGNKLDQAAKEMNYDNIYHLFMYVELANGKHFRMEKNEVVRITSASNPTAAEQMKVSVPAKLNVAQFLKKGIDSVGESSFFAYDARNNNCQVFISTLLKANGLNNASLNGFIMQDAIALFKKLPAASGEIAKKITDLAARLDVLRQGGGDPPKAPVKRTPEEQAKKEKEYAEWMKKDKAERKKHVAILAGTAASVPLLYKFFTNLPTVGKLIFGN